MKLKYLLIVALFVISLKSFSQSSAGPITIKKTSEGTQFYLGISQINLKDVSILLESNPEAHKLIRSAGTNHGLSRTFFLLAGGCLGWEMSLLMDGEDPNLPLAGVAAGLITTAIPLSIRFNKQAAKAIDIYNNSFITGATRSKSELGICYTPSGIGISLTF